MSFVFAYHDATKHHFHAFARGPGRLDWATQPDPFRTYEGTERIPLKRLPPGEVDLPYEAPFQEGALFPAPVQRETLARFFYDALALSAWKEAGGYRWALRVNPSSGNLHPTEGYLVAGPIPGLRETPAVYHYTPRDHALEVRLDLPPPVWEALAAPYPPGTFFVGLTSIHWREAWKYGERAYRYCQHDVGHAWATLALSASALGWQARLVESLGDSDLCRLLGLRDLEDPEAEHPDGLMAIVPGSAPDPLPSPPTEVLNALEALPWRGTPNRLSPAHRDWPILHEVAQAVWKPSGMPEWPRDPHPSLPSLPRAWQERTRSGRFRRIVHQRRSAVAYDRVTRLAREDFYRILWKTLSAPGRVPFSALPWPPCVHLGLFVHRVEGLPQGLYLLVRDPRKTERLQRTLHPRFQWSRPPGCPEGLACYLLEAGNVEALAQDLSCFQEIASDGAFSLGMLTEFEAPIQQYGPWFYRRLYWECGMVGQVVYLEAEAIGLRGTGIGCFFDDPVHEVFGIKTTAFQSLYHFTLGGAVEDSRLLTLPPYPE